MKILQTTPLKAKSSKQYPLVWEVYLQFIFQPAFPISSHSKINSIYRKE